MRKITAKFGFGLTLTMIMALALLPLPVAYAETIWPCGADELINAINEANANGEADTITLQAGCTYDFTSPYAADPDGYGPVALPPITSDVTIQGNGAALTRSGAGAFRFFYVTDAGSLTLRDLTTANGLAQGGNGGDALYDGGGAGAGLGGAIFNRGVLTLDGVTLIENTARGGDGGDDVTIGSAAAGGGGGMGGAGQDAPGGELGGRGGGINGGAGGSGVAHDGQPGGIGGGGGGAANIGGYGDGGSGGFGGGGGGGNTATGGGGFGGGGGGNQSTTAHSLGGFGGGDGGQWAGGGGGGFGGAIFNDAGTLTIINTTLTGNTAQGGNGGPSSGGINGNGGSGYGGAVFNYNGTVVVTNATIANNTVLAGAGGIAGNAEGGGIYNYQDTGTAGLTLVNTILADTPAGNSDCYNNAGTVTGPAANNNLIEINAAGANACDTPAVTSDPQLGALADNGGPTWTMALAEISPALDAVPLASCTVTVDQRGFSRPQRAACDIGAYETESLFLAKAADPAPLLAPGDTLTYTLTFRNDTSLDVTDVLITDVVPSEVTTPTILGSSGAIITPTGAVNYAWQVEDLSPGEWGVITLTGQVDSGLASNLTFVNTVDSYSVYSGNAQHNSASVALTTRGADLALRKAVDDPAPGEGDTIIYTISLFNNGPDDATGVVISDALPLGLTFSSSDATLGSYDSGTQLWTVGNLASTQGAVLTLTAQVDTGTAARTITNMALIDSSDQGDGITANDEATADITVAGADLEMSKTVDNAAPDEGDTVVYTIQVANNGPDNATGVAVSDLLPSGVTYVSDDGGGDYDDATGAWDVGALNATISATLRVTATVDAGTAGSIIVNTAAVDASDQPDSITANDEADATIIVTEADLAMSKTVDDADTYEGDTIVYTLQVTNDGPDDATGVVVNDLLPGGVTYSSDDGGGDYDDATGDWDVGALNATASATLHITATVDTGTANTTVTNVAQIVASDQGDLNNGNDTANAPVIVHAPVLTVTKSVANPVQGAPMTYTIAISNTDPVAPASGVVVTDALPSGASYISGGDSFDGSTIEWTGLSVGTGGSAQASFVVSTCQASLLNEWYRVVTSTQRVDSGWGAPLQTDLSAPTIDASFDNAPTGILLGETAYFTDTTSSDGGPMVAWSWDFGDSDTGSGATTNHTYDAAGSYTVTLWVTDTCGFTANVIVPEAVVVAVADIDVSPTTLAAALAPGGTTTRDLTIANRGSADLDWSVAETPDVPWLTLAPSSGTTPPADSDQVVAVLNAAGLSDGVYNTTLAVTSNDPDEAQVDVSVILTVTTPVYAVDLVVDDATLSGDSGQVVRYDITVTNLGNVEDSFAVTLVGNSWPTAPSLTTVGPLAAGASTVLEVYVSIPAAALDGQTDAVVVMLTSVGDATKSDNVALTTTVVWENKLYLPLVLKNH